MRNDRKYRKIMAVIVWMAALLLLFGGGEEYIVQDQAVSSGIGEKVEVGRGIVDQVLIVFRIVSRVERPSALAVFSVNVSCLVEIGAFTHYSNRGFDELFPKCRRLSHESWNDL